MTLFRYEQRPRRLRQSCVQSLISLFTAFRYISARSSTCSFWGDRETPAAGLLTVIPGCERRTLPNSTTRADENGQGLLDLSSRDGVRLDSEST
jgi:hypothetical protein